MKNKPTSLREIHVSKSDDGKRIYFSDLNNEHWSNYDNEELRKKIKEKNFEKEEIKADITSTDSKAQDLEKTGRENHLKDEKNGNGEKEKILSRLKIYWVRNYPELIIKQILTKIISTIIIGVLSFFVGFWLKGSISDKKINDLKSGFNQQISNIKKDNATTTKQIFNDLYNKKIEEINIDIDNKIDNRLNTINAIQNIDVNEH